MDTELLKAVQEQLRQVQKQLADSEARHDEERKSLREETKSLRKETETIQARHALEMEKRDRQSQERRARDAREMEERDRQSQERRARHAREMEELDRQSEERRARHALEMEKLKREYQEKTRERDRQSQERKAREAREMEERKAREAREIEERQARHALEMEERQARHALEMEKQKREYEEKTRERDRQSQERKARDAREMEERQARHALEMEKRDREYQEKTRERDRQSQERKARDAREMEERQARHALEMEKRDREYQEKTRERDRQSQERKARDAREMEERNREYEEKAQEQARVRQEQIDELVRQLEKQKLESKERDRQSQEEQARVRKEQIDELVRQLEKQKLESKERDRELREMKETHRLSTLPEYTLLCQDAYSKMRIEPNPSLLSKGTVTSPVHKLCPTSLRKWVDFLDIQKSILGQFVAMFPSEKHFFDSRGFTTRLGESILSKPIADEKGLEKFLSLAIERPVTAILAESKKLTALNQLFGLGDGLQFENHPHALSDASDEVAERAPAPRPITPPSQTADNSQIRPDQICIYLSKSGHRRMAFVCEYKAPHKLTEQDLRVGLHEMNVHKDVANRKTKLPPQEQPEARFKFNAERLAASALTQTYHYMIHSGLEYGLIATGRAIVFLKIDWQCPWTLFYHLSEPTPETMSHPGNVQSCSVISQYVAFCLLAMSKGRVHPQNVREDFMEVSKRWSEDFEATIASIHLEDRTAPPGSSAYVPTTYSTVDRTPPVTRSRPIMVANPFCRPPLAGEPSDNYSDDEENGPGAFPDTPCPTDHGSGRSRGIRRSARIHAQGSKSHEAKKPADNEYCTQKCLLGLVNGRELDPRCPNVAAHRAKSTSSRHPVTHTVWLKSLSEQLRRDLDDGVVKLEKEGSYGVLFKIIHLELGYTFVAKGTIAAYTGEIKHEAAIYDQLRPVQGLSIPVYLGSLDLRTVKRTYYYDHRVYIIYLMFLSWAGDRFQTLPTPEQKGKVMGRIQRCVRTLHKHGVVHRDLRLPNILYNAEARRIMIVDFGRAAVLQEARPALASRSANRQSRGPETDKKLKEPSNKERLRDWLELDIAYTTSMF
ncbi:hypothetical protein CDD82_5031 [Ophiocordyceps australis]|uniref:Protein kinase domain-containing protein n=1 Tax=Ophiocordyceps australis TaxID=1399860 RepID=A0A2C5Z3H1_9HYPO|nr:hypothetical protein CDD82_5031 [Ophiocordyceps australis]